MPWIDDVLDTAAALRILLEETISPGVNGLVV
jgi:hypothetical protein